MFQSDANEARTPAPIRNRDIPLLCNVLYAMQDVNMVEQKRQWQQDRLWHMTQQITGMPGGGGETRGLDADFAAISEIEEQYEAELDKYTRELQEAEAILSGISNRKARTFVTMKYVFHIRDKEIMRSLNMTRRAFENIRKSIEQAQNMASVIWPERYILCNNILQKN